MPEAYHEFGDVTQQSSFKIGILAALRPRPTVRSDTNPRSFQGKQLARPKRTIRDAVEEENLSPRMRINELADDLDSSGLRELMERDRKRRERKKEADEARMQRRLQRRADKQREEEQKTQDLSASNAGLGIDSSTKPTPERVRKRPVDDESSAGPSTREEPAKVQRQNPFEDSVAIRGRPHEPIRDPFGDEHDVDIMGDEFIPSIEQEPVLPVKSPLRKVAPIVVKHEPQAMQATTISPPTSPRQAAVDRQSMSQASGLGREITPDIPEHGPLDRRASDQSSGQGLSSWANFFRRGTRRKLSGAERGRTTPSEFSNTSRESFVKRQQPPPIIPPRTFRTTDSTTPQRTMSKFREDLPDFPISPPDSRVQSPETTLAPSASGSPFSSQKLRQSLSGSIDLRASSSKAVDPNVGRTRQEGLSQGSLPIDIKTGGESSGVVALGRSYASVDSEASWFSGGKPSKRSSQQLAKSIRHSQSSLQPTVPGTSDSPDMAFVDDDSMARDVAAQQPHDKTKQSVVQSPTRLISSQTDVDDASNSEDSDLAGDKQSAEAWHQGVGRQATIVQQPRLVKSREGLLKDVSASEEKGEQSESDEDDSSDPEQTRAEIAVTPVMRARSVEYKGHARQISAGSAKLLDIRRSSSLVEGPPTKRFSQAGPSTEGKATPTTEPS